MAGIAIPPITAAIASNGIDRVKLCVHRKHLQGGRNENPRVYSEQFDLSKVGQAVRWGYLDEHAGRSITDRTVSLLRRMATGVLHVRLDERWM